MRQSKIDSRVVRRTFISYLYASGLVWPRHGKSRGAIKQTNCMDAFGFSETVQEADCLDETST